MAWMCCGATTTVLHYRTAYHILGVITFLSCLFIILEKKELAGGSRGFAATATVVALWQCTVHTCCFIHLGKGIFCYFWLLLLLITVLVWRS